MTFPTVRTLSGRPAPLGFVQKQAVEPMTFPKGATQVVSNPDPLPLPANPEPVATAGPTPAPVIKKASGMDPFGSRLGGKPWAINCLLSSNPGRAFTLVEILENVPATRSKMKLDHVVSYFDGYAKAIMNHLDIVRTKAGHVVSVTYVG